MPAESSDSLHLQVGGGRTLISRSPQLHRIWGIIQRVAPTDVSVLVMGRDRHREGDHRAADPQAERQGELLGHERGAFTGADHRGVGVCLRPGRRQLPRLHRDEYLVS